MLKRSTFRIEPGGTGGSLLTITYDYPGTPEAECQDRLDAVDRSLVRWGQDLHAYLRHWKRCSWLAPWRWYMTPVRGPMNPSARRITRWILWIMPGELTALLLVFAIFAIEQ